MSNSIYTVGWICAVRTEYIAARAFLDEVYVPLERHLPNDNATYTLGKMERHYVVITVLPDRQGTTSADYGTVSAARAARNLLRSFPNVRIGLMVGIGGGVPSPRNDVRLGDIVVGTPRSGNSGVFPYTHRPGNHIQDQAFQETAWLNNPPQLLLDAVDHLKRSYERNGHQIQQNVDDVLRRNRDLRAEYMRPDHRTDILYRSNFHHPPPGPGRASDCTEACGSNPSVLVQRQRRSADANPTIHYGLIASADVLMKHSGARDELAAEYDVLCVEMEATGLMNHFPCLVIRGICDYSDSHKNKKWQGYAAMAAAAYAKDMLSLIN